VSAALPRIPNVTRKAVFDNDLEETSKFRARLLPHDGSGRYTDTVKFQETRRHYRKP